MNHEGAGKGYAEQDMYSTETLLRRDLRVRYPVSEGRIVLRTDLERVLSEPMSPAKFYIDSGWPGDNFETTLAMAIALQSRGYVCGRDFVHFAFPLQAHEESAWGSRLHLPLQLFWGKVPMAQRGRNE